MPRPGFGVPWRPRRNRSPLGQLFGFVWGLFWVLFGLSFAFGGHEFRRTVVDLFQSGISWVTAFLRSGGIQ